MHDIQETLQSTRLLVSYMDSYKNSRSGTFPLQFCHLLVCGLCMAVVRFDDLHVLLEVFPTVMHLPVLQINHSQSLHQLMG
jgi:lipid-A-disaccharide synthase-like uncharacterized protein